MQSMLLDAINQDRRHTGLAREGLLSALYAFVEKIAGPLGPFVGGLVRACIAMAAVLRDNRLGQPEQPKLGPA